MSGWPGHGRHDRRQLDEGGASGRMILGMARQPLIWTNPKEIDLSKPCLYFFRAVDPGTDTEYLYVGKSRRPGRLDEYVRNVGRIFRGQPRRTTPGQEQYRAVHLAMAKACEFNWEYEFFPLENTRPDDLDRSERVRVGELSCNLNDRPTWRVQEYCRLRMTDIVREPAQPGPRPAPGQPAVEPLTRRARGSSDASGRGDLAEGVP